jgi:hypothetical protein
MANIDESVCRTPNGTRRVNGDRSRGSYICSVSDTGKLQCTCPDWVEQRSKEVTRCKHADVLRAIGILDDWEPLLPPGMGRTVVRTSRRRDVQRLGA